MDRTERKRATLLGALVADAAALGAHWIYDVDRIAALKAAHGGSAAFLPVDAAHYDGVKGYFAHATRRRGMATQYGATLALAMGTIRAAGGFDTAAYQKDYEAFFGPGGAWHGYVDRPTRGTLANLAAGQTDPSGIDDDQLPALSTLPAVIVAHHGAADLGDIVARAVRVSNVNDTAARGGALFARLLSAVLDGIPLARALAAETAPDLAAALATEETDSTAYGARTGRACHLPMAMPLAFHILSRARGYEDAVQRNIDAGGDSAGRAIVIGALMGAESGLVGIPLRWILALENGASLWEDCLALAG